MRFSSAELSPRDRIPFFRDVCGPNVARLDIEPMGEGAFHAEATLRALPGIGIASTANSAMRVRGTRQLLAGANDDLLFAIPRAGPDIISQGGREITLVEGGAVLVSNADPFESDAPKEAVSSDSACRGRSSRG